ncbi:hypothetical protein SUGI_0110610 [Cryptomeria japonica]|uniref:uncharacterized protein LOC131078838 n=1 Tax=Cryptomeria japonica TaxID=3369 RepID=UPI002408CAEF|nr:uncharacterized protein LOC131078838 [Cryptomeria japonica]GLJ09494.1 hypothetical protein SUGI_0110610 [Cryptomeria japonica]
MDVKGISILLLFGFLTFRFLGTEANRLHAIDIKYPQLFPEGFDWDPKNQHFIVGSMSRGTIHKVSDAGVVEDFIKDNDYAGRAAVLGITVDTRRNRFLAVIRGLPGAGEEGQSGLNALAAYDLKSGKRFFFVELDHVGVEPGERVEANDVAVDPYGNAYVTNSAGNFIWKITLEGQATVFAKSPIFTSQPTIVEDDMAKFCGLNGIVYNKKGALLVSQTNSGMIYKVDLDDGVVNLVEISKPLPWADGITVRRDGVLLVASCHTAWFVQSPDNWGVATVVDEVPMNSSMFATAIALREDNKAYVLNNHLLDYIKKISREEFSIQEIEFPKEAAGEKVWVIVLIVIGLLYVFFWRFQMGYVIKNMNKKRA